MNLIIKLAKNLLNFIYMFVKILPSREKITMLSRQSDKKPLDFILIEEEVKKQRPDITVVTLCKKIGPRKIDELLYFFHILKCMYHIATSKVVIIDGYSIPVSILRHKKELQIIQIWHALGAIKKFGYQVLDYAEGRSSKIAAAMNMHRRYNYIVCASSATKRFYSEAFNTSLEKIVVKGMPRVDYIKADGTAVKNQFYKDYPQFCGKKLVLYIPTFRKSAKKGVEALSRGIERDSEDEYNLIVRPHMLSDAHVEEKFLVDEKYNSFDLMKIADAIVTDYSAAAIEASVLDKPLFFFVFDLDHYKCNRGFNIDLRREVPGLIATSRKMLKEKIRNEKYDYETLHAFRDKYVETYNINNTESVTAFILELI